MSFRPRLWPTILTLVMLTIVIGLGTWQLQRRVWKENLLSQIRAGMDAPPVDLPARLDNSQAWAFRSVRVSGHFDTLHALHLYGRTLEGKAGIHLLVPLMREDGTAVLVDRGFVPLENGDTLAEYAPAPDPVKIEGVVRLPEPSGWFMPADKPAENIWFAVDPAAMSAATGIALSPIYIAARQSDAAGWPRATGGGESLGIRNEHLNYAIFWYSMAGALIIIYVLSSRSRVR